MGKTSDPYVSRHIYFSKQAEQAEKSKKAKQLRQRRVQRVVDWSDARAYDRLAPLDEARDDGGGVCGVSGCTTDHSIPNHSIPFQSNRFHSIPLPVHSYSASSPRGACSAAGARRAATSGRRSRRVPSGETDDSLKLKRPDTQIFK